tara:strand:+ start:1518 stop:2024 length:507 start_codon:yes stop_codon:yes gene_type:complete
VAIVTALTLRTVFHLPLRQTEGFVASLIGLMDLALQTPDHTTLSRRHRSVEVPHLPRGHVGPKDLVIDSTGLKILADGEWQSHKHKTSNQRRSWRKLHLGIDGDGYIIAGVCRALDTRANRRHRAFHRRRSLREPVEASVKDLLDSLAQTTPARRLGRGRGSEKTVRG